MELLTELESYPLRCYKHETPDGVQPLNVFHTVSALVGLAVELLITPLFPTFAHLINSPCN